MNNLKTFFIFIVNCLILIQLSLTKQQTRFDGFVTSIKNAPFLMQIYKDKKFVCSGSLISKSYVLTAATCVYNVYPVHFTVVGIASSGNDTIQTSSVDKIIFPADYSTETFNMDVAMMKLNTEFSEKLTKPIALCKNSYETWEHVQIYGWRKQISSPYRFTKTIYTATIYLLRTKCCETIYKDRMEITRSMFCAAAAGNAACAGDFGGPAIRDGRLCGVMSWGFGCAVRNSPVVYTDVRKVYKFIISAMRQKDD